MVWVLRRPTRVSEVLWDGTYGFSSLSHPRIGDPGAVSPVGGKGATKVLKQKPLGTDPHLTISERSSECWLLNGHNYCPPPNRRTASSECAWVCSYSTAIVSPFSIVLVRFVQGCAVQQKPSFSTLLTRKGTTDDSGKRSAEPFKFAPLSLFPPRAAPFSRTRHFLAFPTLSRLPHYPRAWNRLKSLKCWWGQCVLVMRAISRICGNERQGWISVALSVLFPELRLVTEPTRPTTSQKAGYAPESANLRADIVSSVWYTIRLTFVILTKLKLRKDQSYN